MQLSMGWADACAVPDLHTRPVQVWRPLHTAALLARAARLARLTALEQVVLR
jgi:hypothetical protein